MNLFRILILCLAALLSSAGAQAAWWEFGRQDSEPAITELRFNNVDAARLDDSMVLGREDLQNGVVVLRGRAEVRRGDIGLVEISLNEGKTWNAATLGERGLFTWEFRPEIGRSYPFRIRAISTTGVSTGAEDADFRFMVSAADGNSEARDLFRKLLEAYQRKDRAGFMTMVSPSFRGDSSALDDALATDFRYLDSIAIQANVTRVVGTAGSYELYFTYNRQVRSNRSGQFLKDSAASVMTFRRESEGMKLFSMAAPLLFGVSEPANVATTVTGQAVGSNVLTLDPDTGNASTQQQGTSTSSTSSSTETGTKTLSAGQSYHFDTDTVAADSSPPTTGDILFFLDFERVMLLKNGVRYRLLSTSFDATTSVPESGYNNGPVMGIAAGQVYALEIAPGPKYAVIGIQSVTAAAGPGGSITFRYKYQPGGGRNF